MYDKQIKECEQIAEWLEELKMYKSLAPRELVSQKQRNDRNAEYHKGFNDGYNKAIDDFVEKFIYKAVCEGCSGCCNCYEESRQSECEDYKAYIEIAERLKAGGTDD